MPQNAPGKEKHTVNEYIEGRTSLCEEAHWFPQEFYLLLVSYLFDPRYS